jgi:hypothetical protein
MEFATDNIAARVLLTLATLGYSLLPALADFNKTHATNPLWTPHDPYADIGIRRIMPRSGLCRMASAGGRIARHWPCSCSA